MYSRIVQCTIKMIKVANIDTCFINFIHIAFENGLCIIKHLHFDKFMTKTEVLVFGFAHAVLLFCTYGYILKMKRMIRTLASKTEVPCNVFRR